MVQCMCLLLTARAQAQDFDTAIFSNNQTRGVIDQIEDREERKSFMKLYKEHQPAARRALAEKFLADYPTSWLLAQAYDIGAKACIDLNDGDCALYMGGQSLKLLPENPLLLVPLAKVQLQQGLLAQARESAANAIEFLDRFAAPAGVRSDKWNKLSRELRSASNYLLGRVYATEGLEAVGISRKHLLDQSLEALDAAVSISPEDPEPVYLRGLVLLALGRSREAVTDFRFATIRTSLVQEQAREQLKKLGKLAGTTEGETSTHSTTKSPAADSPRPAAKYAGSQACKPCHAEEFDAWQRTGMAKMLRPYRSENVIGDFTSHNQFSDTHGDPKARMKVDHDRHVFEIRGEHGTWNRYPVDYTIGSKWQQAYATRLPDGRVQVFPIQYNMLKEKWVNYWEIIDPGGSERANLGSFVRMPASGNFQMNCAPCHTSQLRSSGTEEASLVHATFREGGINCEMCHGPSASHALARKEGRFEPKLPLEPPVDFPKIGNRESTAICAQCHMQSAIRELGPREDGTLPHLRQRPYVEFLRKAFYKDGRFRETTFIVESFMRSACFRKGQAQCASCHNPHPAGQQGNQASFKFTSNPDEMCLQCHEQFRSNVERHTRHRAASEGSRCQSCHMPRIMNSLLFQARSHQIDDTPSAENALRFGPAESPIACLECHPKKDASWVRLELQSAHASP